MNQVMPWSSEDSEEEAERWLSSPGCLIQVHTSDKCNILQHHITEEVGNSDIGEVNGPEFNLRFKQCVIFALVLLLYEIFAQFETRQIVTVTIDVCIGTYLVGDSPPYSRVPCNSNFLDHGSM